MSSGIDFTDLITHRAAWRQALEIARDQADSFSPDVDDRSYWEREIEVFDRTVGTLDRVVQASRRLRSLDEVIREGMMKIDIDQDPTVGVVRSFRDFWRQRPAMCHLVGEGSGPQQEAVRVVGKPVKGGGFTVFWVISYDPGQGNARRAYEYLARIYQGTIRAKEVRSEEGIGFHQAMMEADTVSEMDADAQESTSARP